jgi:hypothetical protein
MRWRSMLGGMMLVVGGCWVFSDLDNLPRPRASDAADSAADVRGDVEANGDGGPGPGDSGTSPCSLDTGDAAAVAIVKGQIGPLVIAVDPAPCGAGTIIWGTNDGDGGSVFIADKDGGNVRPLFNNTNPLYVGDIATSDTHVFVAAYSEVRVALLNGGGIGFLAGPNEQAYEVAALGSTAYWGSHYGTSGIHVRDAHEAPCQPGGCTILDTTDGVYALAVDSTGIYWTQPASTGTADGDFTDASIEAADLDGGNRRTLAQNLDSPYQLVLGPDRIYYAPADSLRSVQRDGGGATTLIPNEHVKGLAIGRDRLFWTTAEGEVHSSDFDGKYILPHAQNQNDPRGIAVDDVAIYWVNFGSGEVMRRAR